MSGLTELLLHRQNECTLSWIKQNNTPASAIVSFVYLENKLWMTALEGSRRVKAIRRNPNVSVVISGKGCEVGHSRCVSIQGRCEVFSDKQARDQFFPGFAKAVLPNSEKGAAMMSQVMNSPENLVLVVTPEKTIPYDAHESMERANNA